ncbi:MAG TPA: hypothetical protein PKA00_08745 [Saprospiraceae bacterium]|nr:hypothetical protein [Saprospiraceae bacterium]HMQ82982.1 hypothetical protein [Saprospiraceae bacterium]
MASNIMRWTQYVKNTRMNHLTLLAGICCLMPILLDAQSSYAQQKSRPNASVPNLTAPNASDGIYDKFVLIRWDPVENTSSYKVFRSIDPQKNGLEEVSAGWQNSTWLCDYTALPGVDYYYAVTAANGEKKSALSAFDKGFIKKQAPVAHEDLLLSSNELHAEPKRYFLLVSGMVTDKQRYVPGEGLTISYKLDNVFDREIDRTEIRYFLSKDALLDWDDVPLLTEPKVYSSFPAESSFEINYELSIPENCTPGIYYLFIASSSEKDMLKSKIAMVEIVVTKD